MIEAFGQPDVAVLQAEPPGLEVGEHRLDAPAQAIVEGAMRRRGRGQGDDPGFRMAGLVDHGDVGEDALFGEADPGQPMLAAAETRGEGGFAAVFSRSRQSQPWPRHQVINSGLP